MTGRSRGRPTEQSVPVSATLHVRLSPDEHAAVNLLARRLGVPVSRLLRRAIREMATGGPDLFDDGVEALSRLAAGLSALDRTLRTRAVLARGASDELQTVRAEVEMVRSLLAALVHSSRSRWLPCTLGDATDA